MIISRWLPRQLWNFDFMKPKVENVCLSSILPRMVVTAISATLMNSNNCCTMKVFWFTFCHNFVKGFLSQGSSMAPLLLDFIVNLNKEV